MTDDLLARGVTQIREHHLIDGGDAASRAGDDDRRALAEDPRLYGQRRSAGGATDWKQAYTTEFVQAMQVKP